MAYRAFWTDWNGSVISYPTEGKLWERVGIGLLLDAFPFHPFNALALVGTMIKLKRMVGRYKMGEIDYDVIYNHFNEHVLRGASMDRVQHWIDVYAQSPETHRAVDHAVLGVVRDARHAGKCTGILSTGSNDGIVATLRSCGYLHPDSRVPWGGNKRYDPTRAGHADDAFDFIRANPMGGDSDRRIVNFDLLVFANKDTHARDVLDECGIPSRELVYLGDSPEDEPVFQLAGHSIVSRLAGDDFKQHCATTYGSYTYESAPELSRILRSL